MLDAIVVTISDAVISHISDSMLIKLEHGYLTNAAAIQSEKLFKQPYLMLLTA